MLVIDGVKYRLWTPEDEEKEFHPMIKEHSNEIFGQNCLYFDVRHKLISRSGIGSIPDAYVISLSKAYEWYVVENELASHPVYKHIFPQISKFISGIENLSSQREIRDVLYNEITEDKVLKAFVEKMIYPEEIHHFLSSVVSKPPKIAIIIDEITGEVREASRALKKLGETEVVEFKTFVREDAENVHAHLFEPLYEEEEVVHATYDEKTGKFYCDVCDEKHEKDYALGVINEHLRDEHNLSLDDQVIDGWNKKFQRQMREYFAKKGERKLPPHMWSWEKRLEWIDPSTRILTNQIISALEREIPDITHLPKYRWYYFYRGKSRDTDSLFTVFIITKKSIKVRIRADPKKFKDLKSWTRAYKGWFFRKGEEREFTITKAEQFPYTMGLIKQSYELAK